MEPVVGFGQRDAVSSPKMPDLSASQSLLSGTQALAFHYQLVSVLVSGETRACWERSSRCTMGLEGMDG